MVTGIPGESSDGKSGAAVVVGAVVAVLVIISQSLLCCSLFVYCKLSKLCSVLRAYVQVL